MDRLKLAAPVQKPQTLYTILERLTIDFQSASVYVQMLSEHGEPWSTVYNEQSTPSGQEWIDAHLPKFESQIYQQLIDEGHFTGTIEVK